MKKKTRDYKTVAGIFGSLVLFVGVGAAVLSGVGQISARADEEGAETLRTAIRRASVQCYAIEGRYPPSVRYLEENYGIQIDPEQYYVFYNGFASNVMPEITVIPAMPEEQGGY